MKTFDVSLRIVLVILVVAAAEFPFLIGRADANADSSLAALQKQAIVVRSIDPGDEDFSDLMPLVDKIGKAQVVQLGEATHGDGAAFTARVRLIKFLHQVMGFDVIAWESSLYECVLADAALSEAGADLSRAAGRGIFGIWSSAQELLPLFAYIRDSKVSPRPIEMIGMDCQSTPRFTDAVFAYFDRVLPGVANYNDRERLRRLIEQCSRGTYRPTAQERSVYRALIERLIDMAGNERSRSSARERALIVRALENVLEFEAIQSVPREVMRAGKGPKANIRDIAMGTNVEWLARVYYPDRKIVVWAANIHICEDMSAIDAIGRFAGTMTGLVSEGKKAAELLGEDIYSIAFTAYGGARARVNREPYQPIGILPPDPGSFEDLCHQTGEPYLFVDLKDLPEEHWMRGSDMLARPIGYTPMRGDWPQAFDALFFIDEMKPATPVFRKTETRIIQ